jgi:hypothetical protein
MSQTSSIALNKIKVNPVLILLVAIGVITVGVGDVLKAVAGYDDMGWIIAQWLVVAGSVLIAIGPIAYLGTIKKRVGILAVILGTLAFLARAAAELPSLININNVEDAFWGPFFARAVGASYLMISIAIVSIFWLKEERESRHESNPELSIDLSFRTLGAIGVSTFMIFIAYYVGLTPGGGGKIPTILLVVAPWIVVAVLTATFTKSSKFIGSTGLTVGILAFAILGLSQLPTLVTSALDGSDAWARFLGNGCQGIFHLLLGLQLVIVMKAFKDSHKSDLN